MKLTITINLNNSSFDNGNAGNEAARILERLGNQLLDKSREDIKGCASTLMDSNGNRVGKAEVTE